MLLAKEKPFVTVGLVICNEDRFTIEKIDSLYAKDCENLETIICNNCSTDGSARICKAATESYKWLRYVGRETNIGAPANPIFALERANGDYSMRAAVHDTRACNLIARRAEAPEKRPDAATACGKSNWIDVSENELEKESGCYDTRELDPMPWFIFAFLGDAHPILGIIRTRYLRAIPRIFISFRTVTDPTLLTHQALRGYFIHVRDKSWCRCQPRTEECSAEKLERYNGTEFGMAGSRIDQKPPLLRLPVEQPGSVLCGDLSWIRRVAVLMALLPTFLVRYLAGRQ